MTCVALMYIALDVNRLQPWVYQYTAMLLVASLARRQNAARAAFRIMLASIYFWSGVHKLTPSYFNDVFPRLVFAFPYVKDMPISFFGSLGIATAFIEIFLGTLLIFGKARRIAAAALICMHVVILFLLGPWGHNWNQVVWPWNGVMIALLYLLFIKKHEPSLVEAPLLSKCVVTGFCVVIPFLSLFGIVNRYMGFALYSGNPYDAYVTVSSEALTVLPASITRVATRSHEDSLLWTFRVLSWSMEEAHVPTSPASAVIDTSVIRLCDMLQSIHEPKKIERIERNGFLGWNIVKTGMRCS